MDSAGLINPEIGIPTPTAKNSQLGLPGAHSPPMGLSRVHEARQAGDDCPHRQERGLS